MSSSPRIDTLGQLKAAIARGEVRRRPVRDEVRDNLSERLKRKETLFPGIIGYDDTVIPQLVNAVLARHHFILLGLRGQAKTRILRALTTLLDEWLPVIPESEINDDPIAPLSAFGQQRVKAEGDADADSLAAARGALRRKARDAGRDDRRHDRRHRSDQGREGRAAARQRAVDALRPAAARQPRHLRDQRAARPRRQDPGRPLQHPAGRRRPD